MRIYTLLLLCFISTKMLKAQDSTRSQKTFSIKQGITHIVTKDLYRSPYVYQRINPYVAMNFGINAKKYIQQIHFEYIFGSIRNSFSPLAPINLFRIDYSYLRRVLNNDRYSLYIGPQVNGQSWNVNYFPEMQAPRYGQVRSYLLAISLDAALRFEYKINSKSRVRITASSPVCAYVERPHFLDGSSNQSQFGLLNYRNPRILISYEYDVSKRFSISINYKYEYLQYAQPKAIRMLNNSLFIGVKFKF